MARRAISAEAYREYKHGDRGTCELCTGVTKNLGKEIAKKYLNILFRSIQFDTLFALKKQIKERKNGNSKD